MADGFFSAGFDYGHFFFFVLFVSFEVELDCSCWGFELAVAEGEVGFFDLAFTEDLVEFAESDLVFGAD